MHLATHPASGERRASFCERRSALTERKRETTYPKVTDRIIAELEAGREPWGKSGIGLPRNGRWGPGFSGVTASPATPREVAPLASEPPPEGEQTLVPGVRPISTRRRVEIRMARPLRPRVPQKPFDIGLFDEDARNQLDLF